MTSIPATTALHATDAERAAASVPIALTENELGRVLDLRHGDLSQAGWVPRLHRTFGYVGPDEHYEAMLSRLVTPSTRWLDVGCGRMLLPANPRLAQLLADRCKLLVGVDPSDTLDENLLVHRRVKLSIADYRSSEPFDLVTLRMVAEHIGDPRAMLAAVRRLTASGSRVVVYTVNQWSPVPVLTRFVPFRWRHALKNLVWSVESRDTHPTSYRMNSRRRLWRLFGDAGFQEAFFAYLDDCRASGRHRRLRIAELTLRRLLRRLGMRYPETCLLGVYERR